MAGDEIKDFAGHKLTLEERIIKYVSAGPKDSDLKEIYTDAADRNRVVNRSRISALLSAVFDHASEEQTEEENKSHELDHFAEIQRSFSHDAERLDNALEAELLLVPAGREAMQPKKLILAKRKRLLRWLVLIQLWNPAKDTEFSSQKALLKAAATALGSSEGAVKTGLSQLGSAMQEYRQRSGFGRTITDSTERWGGRFSSVELDFCCDLEAFCRELPASPDDISPFALLKPALFGLRDKPL